MIESASGRDSDSETIRISVIASSNERDSVSGAKKKLSELCLSAIATKAHLFELLNVQSITSVPDRVGSV